MSLDISIIWLKSLNLCHLRSLPHILFWFYKHIYLSNLLYIWWSWSPFALSISILWVDLPIVSLTSFKDCFLSLFFIFIFDFTSWHTNGKLKVWKCWSWILFFAFIFDFISKKICSSLKFFYFVGFVFDFCFVYLFIFDSIKVRITKHFSFFCLFFWWRYTSFLKFLLRFVRIL